MSIARRKLGRTEFEVSPIGIGTGSLGAVPEVSDPDEIDHLAVETLRTALEAGLNYIDTSPGYREGHSDRRVGLALREGRREGVVLATKVGSHPERPGDFTAATARWIIEQSLDVMETDSIDVGLVHKPHVLGPDLGAGGAVEAMEAMKSAGKVCAVGIGVQNHDFLRTAIESGRFDVVQSPYDFNLLRTTSAPLIERAAERGVGFINASPFSAGLLAGVDPDEIVAIRAATGMWSLRQSDIDRAREVWRWATERDLDLRALAMQFCLREHRISTTLIGPRRPSDVIEDLDAATTHVAGTDWALLEEALPLFPTAAPGGEAAVGPYPPDA